MFKEKYQELKIILLLRGNELNRFATKNPQSYNV